MSTLMNFYQYLLQFRTPTTSFAGQYRPVSLPTDTYSLIINQIQAVPNTYVVSHVDRSSKTLCSYEYPSRGRLLRWENGQLVEQDGATRKVYVRSDSRPLM